MNIIANFPLAVFLIFLGSFMLPCRLPAQVNEKRPFNKMVRLYVDNDLFAYRNEDGGYSNGIRLDFFYERQKEKASFVDRLMLKSSKNAVNTYGWSIMQIMITANDITKEEWERGDYPYSGSLFVTHSLISVDPLKNLSIKTEWVLGIMGPHAYAGEVQTWFHQLIGSSTPLGWHYQMPTSLLVNLNVSFEKSISGSARYDINVGGDAYAGTMWDAIGLSTTIRFGKMNPYSGHVINRTNLRKSFQAYLTVKPHVNLIFHDTLLEGSLFRRDNSRPQAGGILLSESEANNFLPGIDYGIVISYGHVAFSFAINTNTGRVQYQPNKSLGNVSLYFAM